MYLQSSDLVLLKQELTFSAIWEFSYGPKNSGTCILLSGEWGISSSVIFIHKVKII